MSTSSTARVLLIVGLAVTFWTAGAAQSNVRSFANEVRMGEEALEQRRFLSALEAFSRANALRNKTSAEAWFGMARASYGQGVFAESLRSCDRALTFVSDQDLLKAAILRQRGLSLVALASGPDDARLQEAGRDFRAAISLNPQLTDAVYHLGAALLAAYRDAEGLVELKRYFPQDTDLEKTEATRRLLDNPRRARERFAAPPFSIAGPDGKVVTSASLAGKVIVLDFWGTWCPPCRANTPDLVRLSHKYKDQPVVFIGIGVAEKSEEAWRSYIAEHKMAWLQVLDGGRANEITQVFRVSAVPDYVVVDGDGIIRTRLQEWGPEGPVALDSAIQKALMTITR
jgi:thiol-disulfide isomerase/thioredoxin